MKTNAVQYLIEKLKERYGWRAVLYIRPYAITKKQKINVRLVNGVLIRIVDNRKKYENKRRKHLGWDMR